MQVIVKATSGEISGEWTIIELQGELESRGEESLPGKFIGDLHFSQGGVPILIIGHHVLHGKLVKLDKPLAVMERVSVDKNNSKEVRASCMYVVKALVSKKVLFRARPKPIVENIY